MYTLYIYINVYMTSNKDILTMWEGMVGLILVQQTLDIKNWPITGECMP